MIRDEIILLAAGQDLYSSTGEEGNAHHFSTNLRVKPHNSLGIDSERANNKDMRLLSWNHIRVSDYWNVIHRWNCPVTNKQ